MTRPQGLLDLLATSGVRGYSSSMAWTPTQPVVEAIRLAVRGCVEAEAIGLFRIAMVQVVARQPQGQGADHLFAVRIL